MADAGVAECEPVGIAVTVGESNSPLRKGPTIS